MKTRNGFVSNSSSSSFIVKVKKPFLSVFEVADYMISCRGWKNDDETRSKIKEMIFKGMDINTSLMFPTCNYSTYIVKQGDRFYISTCNNHDFPMLKYQRRDPEDFGYDDDACRFVHMNMTNHTFYRLMDGKIGRPKEYEGYELDYCQKMDKKRVRCGGEIWWIQNGDKMEKQCTVCGKVYKDKKRVKTFES